MQLPPIEIIFNLHSPIPKVCAIKLFYSRRLYYFLYHCSHSNLTLGSDTSCRELTRIPNLWETKKNRENTHQRKQSHAQDNIYVVRKFAYVHRVAGISLLLGKNIEYNLRLQYFLAHKKHGLSLSKSLIKNHATLFGSGHQTGSSKTRLHKAQHVLVLLWLILI